MTQLHNKLALGIGLTALNVIAVTLPLTVQADTQTTNTAIGLTISPVITAYSSGPTVTLGTIIPTAGGLQSTASDTVSASTNDSLGLTMTLEENGATTAMTSGANTIPASAGTPASPVAVVSNTWGWRLDGLAGFGAGPTSVITNAAPSALTFAAIPAMGSPYTINTTAVPGSTASTVWYSSRINTSQATGTYSTTVKYTITTN